MEIHVKMVLEIFSLFYDVFPLFPVKNVSPLAI